MAMESADGPVTLGGGRASSCPVCGGSGFVKAAPLSTPAINGGIKGRVPKYSRVVLWPRAVVVPCFACTWVGDGQRVVR